MYVYSFKELIVWQKAMELTKQIYKDTESLPSTERFGLVSQMRRAAVSIPCNIAEGKKRKSKNDYLHFLRIANGSAAELETQLILCGQIFPSIEIDQSASLLDETQRMMTRMIEKVEKLPSPSSKLRAQQGFTILEVGVVVAIVGIISLLVAPFLVTSMASRDVDTYASEAVDALREAQSSVMSGRNAARYGVHFESARFVFFQGATYNVADPDNIVHALPGTVTVTEVALSPGGACTVATGSGNCDVHYARRRGTPTESGTVAFTGDEGTVKTITINAQGMIDVN